MMSILRIESMLLDLEHFKVFRTKEGDDDGPRVQSPCCALLPHFAGRVENYRL
jgi:hypothetical protein